MLETIRLGGRPVMLAAVMLLWSPVGLAAQGEIAQDQDPAVVQAEASALRKTAFTAERAGDHGAAAEAFLKLTKIEAKNPNWVVRAADNLGKAGRFNDAMELIEGARKQFPDVPSLDVTLARTYHLKADTMRADGIRDSNVVFYYQDTVRIANGILEKDPKHLEALLLRASSRFQLFEMEAALTDAVLAAEQHPSKYGGHAMIGRICLHRYLVARQRMTDEKPTGKAKAALIEETDANRKQAEDAFRAAAEADPNRSFPVVKLADIAAWSGRLGPALDQYSKAIAIDPRAKVDHGWLRSTITPDQRIELYRRAGEGYSKRADASPAQAALVVWYLAQAYFDRATANREGAGDDWKIAIQLFESTLTALPDYHDTYHYLFQATYWSGNEGAAGLVALTFARKAPVRFADLIRDDEQTLAVVRGMAASRYRAKKLAESRDLNQVLAYADATADAWNNYAFLCRETGEFQRSFDGYQNALLLEPDSPQLLNDAAVILQYHLRTPDNLARARELYGRAIAAAEKQIGAGNLPREAIERARTALRDARANLQKLSP